MAAYKSRFGELLREARDKAAQTPDVMAILLNLEPEAYQAIEAGTRFPDDETLKRLCMMMEWNYYETQRVIRNEMASPARAVALGPSLREAPPLQGYPLNPDGTPGASKVESLGARLKDVRLLTGQSTEIIAALLNLSVEAYQRLEDGEPPSDELLRRISMVYNWNYHDLLTILRTEQARDLQPRRQGNPFPGTSVRLDRLRVLCREIETAFAAAPEAEQEMMLAQLELIRGTAQHYRRTQSAPGSGAAEPAQGRRKPAITPPLPGLSDRKIFPA